MALNEDKIVINVVAQVNDSELKKGLDNVKSEVDKVNSSDDLDIKIKTTIDSFANAKSLGDLKSSLKELQSLAIQVGDSNTEALTKVNLAAGQVKDQIGDLKDGFNSLSGSPIENVGSSFAALKQKIGNLDIEGVKQQFGNLTTSLGGVAKGLLGIEEGAGLASIGFKGLGKAIIATGLGALVIAAIALITHFDELKASGGLLGKALTALGDIISGVVKFFTDLTDAIGLTDIAGQKLAENTAKNNKKINDSYQESLDFQVALLKAQGKNSADAEKAAQAQREQTARQELFDLKAQGKEKTDEYKQQALELKKQKDATTLLNATLDKQASDKDKEAAKKKLEDLKKGTADTLKALEEAARAKKDKQETLDQIELTQSRDKDLEEVKLLSEKIIRYEDYSAKELKLLKITEEQRQLIIAQSNARIDEIEKKAIEDSIKLDELRQKTGQENKQKEIDAHATKVKAIDSLDVAKAQSDQTILDSKIKQIENNYQLEVESGKNTAEQLLALEQEKNNAIEKLNEEAFQKEIDLEEEKKQKKQEIFQGFIDAIAENFRQVGETIGGVAGQVFDGLSNITESLGNAIKTFGDDLATTNDKIVAGLQVAQDVVSTIGEALQSTSNENIAANDRETKKKLSDLDKRAKTEKLTEAQIAQAKYLIQLDAYKKDLELRKKAFRQQKAIQIVNAVIGTALGVVSALANPFPLNIVMAVLAGITGAVQIGLIAAQKFPEGEGAPSAPAPPAIPTPSDVGNQAKEAGQQASPDQKFIAPQFFGLGGKQIADMDANQYQKVYVVESDITGVQRKVNVIEDRAKIG